MSAPTFFTRVEAWECDHNQHWNVRHYMRCFQQASFVASDICGTAVPPALTHHTRYHSELLEMAPVAVRSAVLTDGAFAGATVHLLTSNGRLSATALEQPGHGAGLPGVSAAEVRLALPRGIDGAPHAPDDAGAPAGLPVLEHGMVQAKELDHTGSIGLDWLMGRIAVGSSEILGGLGFTPEFARTHRISRMGVETKLTRHAPIPLGTRLRSTVRIASTGRKNLVLRHVFEDAAGVRLAVADQSLVTVDMTTRRATELPDFLRNAAE